ncbi:MAG: enoyl-CoA hydratase/isomerase family protein [Bdellovibrionales bacterium]|nr:enoyl-CoA hydratase/isomerase family protein [Bdellovibrionales bacterium]
MEPFKTLQFELSDGVGQLTICRPQSLNSLNFQTLQELNNFAKHTPEDLQVLIIKGAGDRAFVAGGGI